MLVTESKNWLKFKKFTTDHDHDKYLATQEFNKLTSENLTERWTQANLASKKNIPNFVKKTDLNDNELNKQSEKVKAISPNRSTKDLINIFSILNGAKYFSSGIFQDYLVFIRAKKYVKYFNDTTRIDSWKSNGMSEENIENISKPDRNLVPTFDDHHSLLDLNFNGPCLINNICFPKKVMNIYIFLTY